MAWTCVNKNLPENFGKYDVTLEDSFSGSMDTNVALFRPKNEQWELLIEPTSYEGWRVIAWKEQEKPFDWKEE